jgi:hypothetical protein|nr:MAG TPA: hypothetical protein [Caudoviricetes sp.]
MPKILTRFDLDELTPVGDLLEIPGYSAESPTRLRVNANSIANSNLSGLLDRQYPWVVCQEIPVPPEELVSKEGKGS